MRTRIASPFVLVLIALAPAGPAAARHDDNASAAARVSSLRAYVHRERSFTWQWQDRAGVRRWPTKYLERTTRAIPALHWLARLWHERHHQAQTSYRAPRAVVQSVNDWVARQIRAAESIGHSAKSDPWPNCPDPIWNGAASWQDTVNCENGGNWLDSPGYYRCGLQFDPSWERVYGRLCP